jgi:hypothetical protein
MTNSNISFSFSSGQDVVVELNLVLNTVKTEPRFDSEMFHLSMIHHVPHNFISDVSLLLAHFAHLMCQVFGDRVENVILFICLFHIELQVYAFGGERRVRFLFDVLKKVE